MADNQQSSYRSIFKATSLFGGVQVYNIIIGIIKSKIIAVLLGTVGMGIMGLFQSTISFIQGLTCLGLGQSAVRDVSEANATGNSERINHIVAVLNKLVWITGLIGMGVCLVLSPFLSKFTFGNYDYTIPFILLSSILLIDQIRIGQGVLLQGLRRLKDLAKASTIGATLGLVISIPFYYLLKVDGIAPTLVLTSISYLVVNWLFVKRINIPKEKVSLKSSLQDGRLMMKMGIAMTINSIIVLGVAYLLRWFIRLQGGLEEVGLFTAGFTIVNTYAGMVFNAMATDYYPRLAAVNNDNEKGNLIINQQIEIATLVIAPLMVLCIVFMPFVIKILYSDQFLRANVFIIWASAGIIFKAISWALSYNFIAKGKARQFIINEVGAKLYSLPLQFGGYYLMGLKGLGIAFLLSYLLYSIQLYIVSRNQHNYSFSASFGEVFIIHIVLLAGALILALTLKQWQIYTFGSLVAAFSIFFALRGLNARMNLKSALLNSNFKKR